MDIDDTSADSCFFTLRCTCAVIKVEEYGNSQTI
jgi:hypothetical protein